MTPGIIWTLGEDMGLCVLRLDLDLGVFQNLLYKSEEYSNHSSDWLKLPKYKLQLSLPLQIWLFMKEKIKGALLPK